MIATSFWSSMMISECWGQKAAAPAAHDEPILFSSAQAFKCHAGFEKATCVILDINLNDGSGIELGQGLKAAASPCRLSSSPGTKAIQFAKRRAIRCLPRFSTRWPTSASVRAVLAEREGNASEFRPRRSIAPLACAPI